MRLVLDSQTVYELAVVYYPKTGDDHTKSVEVVKKIVKEANGEIKSEDVWDVQDLAYPIKKQTSGIYAFYQLTFSSLDRMKQLANELNISNHVLRHLLTKLDLKRIEKAKALAEKLAKQKALAESESEAESLDKESDEVEKKEVEDKKEEVDEKEASKKKEEKESKK